MAIYIIQYQSTKIKAGNIVMIKTRVHKYLNANKTYIIPYNIVKRGIHNAYDVINSTKHLSFKGQDIQIIAESTFLSDKGAKIRKQSRRKQKTVLVPDIL